MFDRLFNSLHKFLVPMLAALALGTAIYKVWGAQQEPPPKPPFTEPAKSPFEKGVAGSGITEARTENIAIGTAVPGLVTEVKVRVGDEVKPGDLLFKIDDRALAADRKVRVAMLKASQATLDRWKGLPRAEDVPPSEFKVLEAKERIAEAEDKYERFEKLLPTRAISEEEFIQARQQLRIAKAQYSQLDAQHKLLLKGAWEQDIAVAEANIAQQQAELDKIDTELSRLEVRAPQAMDVPSFKVLQVNVRPGEYVGAPNASALIVLGDIERLHVRVDIDEYDIPRFTTQGRAVAKLRGNPKQEFELTFVRIDPYVIPKRSLTGDNTERVDTRVLQVIYALDAKDQTVFVGQQMDVFLEEKK